MIAEDPDLMRAALAGSRADGPGSGPEREAGGVPAVRDPLELAEMRVLAGLGFGQGDLRYGGQSYGTSAYSSGDFGGGWGGWGSAQRCPPALVMSTAALRCRVVILDNLAKARPYIRDKDTKKEYTGEFADRVMFPMGAADPGMSLKRWVTVNVSNMLEQGDAHIWKSEERYLTRFARNGQRLRKAYIPLPVGSCEPQQGKAFWNVSEWIYSDPTTGQVVRIPPEELARIEYLWNPRDYHRGIGPMEACRLAIETDYWYALQARNRQMKGGLPALLLMNQRAGTQDSELRAFLGEFRRQMADERGGIAGLGSDWKVERLGMTAVEADEINTRRYMIEEVARAHGIPLIDLGVYSSTGFGREGMDILNTMRHTATINPLAMRFSDGVTQQIMFEIEPGLEFAFDWSRVRAAQDDLGEMIGYAERLFALGVPMDEAARLTSLALEDYPGKDLGFLQASLLTMEEILIRVEAAKAPPEPVPEQLMPFTGGPGEAPPGEMGATGEDEVGEEGAPQGGPPPDIVGTTPEGDDEDAAEGEGAEEGEEAEESEAADGKGDDEEEEDEDEEEEDEKKASGRAERVRVALAGARMVAAAVLEPAELDRLEAAARRVGWSARTFDRFIAKATPREVNESIAFQKRVNPHAKRIQKAYEKGINKGFKSVNDQLWKLQKKRPKIRLLAGEPEPVGRQVFTDSKGNYYFGAVDPLLVDPLVDSIGLDTVRDQILDLEGTAYDEGVDTMTEEMRRRGWIGAAAGFGAAALANIEKQREDYLEQRQKIIDEAFAKVRDQVQATVADGFAAGEDIGSISKRLMRDVRPSLVGGDRAVLSPSSQLDAEEPEVLDEFEAAGRGEMWGDEEAYLAANAARNAVAISARDDLGGFEGEEGEEGEGRAGGELWWRWLTMEDDKVRPAHDEIFGKAVPIGDEFIEGTGLTYPGDPAADPELTINCRCWTVLLAPEEIDFELAA